MFINKDGKVFGRFNLLDLTVISVVISAVIFGGIRLFLSIKSEYAANNDSISYTLKVKAVRLQAAQAFHVNDGIYDQLTDKKIGTIKSVSYDIAKEYVNLADGSLSEKQPIPDKYDVLISAECPGNITDEGYFLNGNMQVANLSTMSIYTKYIKCTSQISEIGK